jgi:uncharacterized protein YndB with AHSA1/START domain
MNAVSTQTACAALMCIVTAFGPAAAEVSAVTASSFELRDSTHIAAPPDKVYGLLIQPAHWWSSDHTFSGHAANLTLDARAGGCWCEALPGGGSVEHLRVVYVAPGKLLRLRGALGPFQGLAVDGVMTWSIKAVGNGTDLTFSYVVAGYSKDGFDDLAKSADQVLGDQLAQLKKIVEAGSAAKS